METYSTVSNTSKTSSYGMGMLFEAVIDVIFIILKFSKFLSAFLFFFYISLGHCWSFLTLSFSTTESIISFIIRSRSVLYIYIIQSLHLSKRKAISNTDRIITRGFVDIFKPSSILLIYLRGFQHASPL